MTYYPGVDEAEDGLTAAEAHDEPDFEALLEAQGEEAIARYDRSAP